MGTSGEPGVEAGRKSVLVQSMTLPLMAADALVSALKRDADTNHPQVGPQKTVRLHH